MASFVHCAVGKRIAALTFKFAVFEPAAVFVAVGKRFFDLTIRQIVFDADRPGPGGQRPAAALLHQNHRAPSAGGWA